LLKDWETLLAGHATEARDVLDGALADRIKFTPDSATRQFTLTMPLAFGRVLERVVPELRGGLQESMASPTGFGIDYQPEFQGIWRSDRRAA
jgi:hypothetical protein